MLYKRFPLPQITGQETANGAFLALAIFAAVGRESGRSAATVVIYVKMENTPQNMRLAVENFMNNK